MKKVDFSGEEFKWLTVDSPEGLYELELLLEPNAHPATRAYQICHY